MAKITNIIEERNFEKVLTILGGIIFDELSEQKTLQGFSDAINVYKSRTSPFNFVEKLMINVSLSTANYDIMTRNDTRGTVYYNIDLYVSEKATDSNNSGEIASIKLNKFIGMVMYILNSDEYTHLELAPGIIGTKAVEDFTCFDDEKPQETTTTKIGRLRYMVKMTENRNEPVGVNLLENHSLFTLDLTDKGYKYEYIKN